MPFIAVAAVEALRHHPILNASLLDNSIHYHAHINLGIAVDVEKKDGTRTLMVPVIRDAGRKNFADFKAAFDGLIEKARTNTLTADDLTGANISLTNPGGIGTIASVPRLMVGQGTIVATGSIGYPPGLGTIGQVIGAEKVMTMTSTYDHRVIQGAESGAFLGQAQELLDGGDGFYEEIFEGLRVPHQPIHWQTDRLPLLPGANAARRAEIANHAGIIQMINAYRVRGHLIADLDPLGRRVGIEPPDHLRLQHRARHRFAQRSAEAGDDRAKDSRRGGGDKDSQDRLPARGSDTKCGLAHLGRHCGQRIARDRGNGRQHHDRENDGGREQSRTTQIGAEQR